MPDIFKVLDANGDTHWFFNPGDIIEIADTGIGCSIRTERKNSHYHIAHISDVKAIAIKRSIQERLEEPLGFLKLRFNLDRQTEGNRYINIKFIHAVVSRDVVIDRKDVQRATLSYGHHLNYKVDMEPGDLAFQIRRVLKRLEQDEEICCEAPVEEESTEDA